MKGMLKIVLVIGVISMVTFYGCSGNMKYERYSSKDTELNVTMDYISGWMFSESRGAKGSYAQVTFYEPERKDKSIKAGIVFMVQESAQLKLQTLNIEAFADDLLEKRKKLQDMKVLSRAKAQALGHDAVTFVISYRMLDKFYRMDAQLAPIQEKIVLVKINDKFYTIRYQNVDKEFSRFNKAFDHIVKTINFKNSK
ncbi:MAG: hypothetical protein WDL87_02185 [Candidatus Omnitrophota bacterium]|jgi:hypothetical protein